MASQPTRQPLSRPFRIGLCLATFFALIVLAPCRSAAPETQARPDSALPACASLRLLIPLYSYPNWYDAENYLWDDVAAANSRVPVSAIINPDSGPDGCPPNSDYQHGLDELRSAGVELLGYVYTSYGERAAEAVKADVDLYNQCFEIDGIFFDEAASDAGHLGYYSELFDYVKSRPNLDSVVLNPGTNTDEGYISAPASDTAILFESQASDWPSYLPDPYVSSYPAGRFAMLAYNTPGAETMCSHIALAESRNFGYVYLTDDTLPNPWDSLPTFWGAELDCIETLNTCAVWLPLVLNMP